VRPAGTVGRSLGVVWNVSDPSCPWRDRGYERPPFWSAVQAGLTSTDGAEAHGEVP